MTKSELENIKFLEVTDVKDTQDDHNLSSNIQSHVICYPVICTAFHSLFSQFLTQRHSWVLKSDKRISMCAQAAMFTKSLTSLIQHNTIIFPYEENLNLNWQLRDPDHKTSGKTSAQRVSATPTNLVEEFTDTMI